MKKSLHDSLSAFFSDRKNKNQQKSIFLLLFLISNVLIYGKALSQNTIIDNSGEAGVFFINDYPHARDAFWGNNDLAANGLAHDNDNWFIASVNRDYFGHSKASSGWTLFKIPVYKDLNTENVGFPNGVILRLQSSQFSQNSDLKDYGHMGDIDYVSHENVGYVVAPLYGSNTSFPIIGFFKADNLEYKTYAKIPNSANTGWCAIKRENDEDYLFTSYHNTEFINKYKIIWENVLNGSKNGLEFVKSIRLPYYIRNMQGGEFSPNGEFLFLTSGLFDCTIPFFGSTSHEPEDGIHLMKYTDDKISSLTHSVNAKHDNTSTCFDLTYENNDCYDLEPEGLTFWDLSSGKAPGISGQLHVLLDDHDATWGGGPLAGGGKINLKHYKSFKTPADITVFGTTANGEPSSNPTIKSFLTQGVPILFTPFQIYNGCATLYHDAPTIFPPGKTPVTFTILDNVFTIKSTAYVNVIAEHDEYTTALKLNPCDRVVSNNFCATPSNSAPTITNYSGAIKDVWFKIYPTSSSFSIETFQVSGGLTNTVIQVLSESGNNLHEIGSDDSSGDGDHAKVVIKNLTNLDPLYIRITDYGATHYGKFGIYFNKNLDSGANIFSSTEFVSGDGHQIHDYPPLIGDVNGDGRSDLIFEGQDWTGDVNLCVRVKLGNADGTFTALPQQNFGDGSMVHTYPPLIGDVNGDGRSDLIFEGQDWTGDVNLCVRVKLGNADGIFTALPQQNFGDGSMVHTYPPLIGDVNGDGKSDLIFEGQDWSGCGLNIRVKFANDDSTWCTEWQLFKDENNVHDYLTLAGDVNGDRKTDIIFNFDDALKGLIIKSKISTGLYCLKNDTSSIPITMSTIVIFPNPTNDYIQFKADTISNFNIKIINSMGVVLFAYSKISSTARISLASVPNGLYFIDITDAVTGKRTRGKVIKISQ